MAAPVTLTSGTGVEAGTAGNPIYVNTGGAGTSDVNLTEVAGEAVTAGSGNVAAGTLRVTVAADSTGQIIARGPVADDAAASGNPVPVGGIYNSSLPTYSNGDRTQLQANVQGSALVAVTGQITGDAVSATLNAIVDRSANSRLLATASHVYNGASFDRAPGTTAGAYGIIRDAAGNARGANVNASNQLQTFVANVSEGEYETVAAGQTAQVLGATGATGDFLAGILVVPATTSPGNVIILDNATSITVFAGGASSVSNLVPFWIPIGANSVSGAWKVTTGSNVSCIGVGNFT